jgi:hypothetical protein
MPISAGPAAGRTAGDVVGSSSLTASRLGVETSCQPAVRAGRRRGGEESIPSSRPLTQENEADSHRAFFPDEVQPAARQDAAGKDFLDGDPSYD